MTAELIDVNVHIGPWPTRQTLGEDPTALFGKLKQGGVIEAWVGSFAGVFHRDLAGANARLAEACGGQKELRLVPLGAINPVQSDWEEALTRCVERHAMPGVRVYPSYHGYTLEHPAFLKLLQMTAERKRFVAIAALMEDERMMHPLMRVPELDVSPLEGLVKRVAGGRVVILNAGGKAARVDVLRRLTDAGEVYVDMAMLEGVGGLERLVQDVPAERVLFGSNAPSFYFEAAALKLQESPLGEEQLRAICRENARRLAPSA